MMPSFKNFTLVSLSVLSLLSLSACDLTRNNMQMDRDANMNVQDFRDALQPRTLEEEPAQEAQMDFEDTIPGFDTYITEPAEAEDPVPLVSVSVNQTVPLRDVLFELAKQADVDLELDPNITGSIILTARNKPFDLVIKRIANMAGLRYNFEDGILRIENDYPYQETYQLEYINLIRDTETNVLTSIRIGSSGGGQEAASETDTGSDYSLNTSSTGDFWGEIEENISHILTEDVEASLLKTREDPAISVSVAQPAPVSPTGQGQTGQRAPAPRLNVQSLPADDARPRGRGARAGGRGGEEEEQRFQPTFSINQQSGIVTVYASERIHKKVNTFLERIKEIVTAQVLIEAKVLEVELTDEHATGINWAAILDESGDTQFGTNFVNTIGDFGEDLARPELTPTAVTNFRFASAIEDVDVFVDALSRFGTVRALASPRITVLNNQPASLNVTESRVYFEIEIETEEEGETDDTSVEISSETLSVPEGVIINVHPSIDTRKNSTILALKPSVTRVVDFIGNPASAAAVALAQADTEVSLGELRTEVPELSVQEFDSIIKLNSGEVAVLGGLLEDRVESQREGVPVLSEVPMVGSLFRSQGDRIVKSELVILIKTTILKSASESVHDTDRQIYKKFSGDRRPFDL